MTDCWLMSLMTNALSLCEIIPASLLSLLVPIDCLFSWNEGSFASCGNEPLLIETWALLCEFCSARHTWQCSDVQETRGLWTGSRIPILPGLCWWRRTCGEDGGDKCSHHWKPPQDPLGEMGWPLCVLCLFGGCLDPCSLCFTPAYVRGSVTW